MAFQFLKLKKTEMSVVLTLNTLDLKFVFNLNQPKISFLNSEYFVVLLEF
jgi:hypothetical protein